MAGIESWELLNTPRDLTDILSTLISQRPIFLNKFPRVENATNVKKEWLEDVLKPRSVAFSAFDTTTGAATVADTTGWEVGDYVRVKGDSAIFKVTAVTANTSITLAFVASNGSATDAIADVSDSGGTLIFDHHPVGAGSTSGTSLFSQSGTEYNYTEILRGDIEITNTALASRTYGNENSMTYQLERAMIEIMRQANKIAVNGIRSSAPASGVKGTAGGLYYFGNQTGGLSVNATSGGTAAALSLKLINDAAQEILNAGGNPDLVLCGPGQARVLSQIMRSQIHLSPGETQRGAYANSVISESTGQVMQVLIEPSLAEMDTDVWVIDSTSLGMSYLAGRELHSEPTTAPDYDGKKWSIIGEMTFIFKNAKQKLCRIKGLKASSSALA